MKTPLFTLEKSKSTLEKALYDLQQIPTSEEFEKERKQHTITIIKSMRNNPDEWDSHCQINISWIGEQLLSTLDQISPNNDNTLSSIFLMCYRFLIELDLTTKGSLNHQLEAARNFTIEQIGNFESNVRTQINFANTSMPIAILKQLINSEAATSLLNLETTQTKAEEKREAWLKELNNKEENVEKLKNDLDKYETAYNFVGLHQGFDQLHRTKQSENNTTLTWLIIFGFLIPLPLSLEIAIILHNIQNIEATKDIITLTIIPSLSISALLIYFFRIILSNYKSTKSLLLQIDLRKTLCAFIQNYSSYASDIKTKDKDALEKFESIIFSSLVPDESNIPSTFDGINQLASLIKSIKN